MSTLTPDGDGSMETLEKGNLCDCQIFIAKSNIFSLFLIIFLLFLIKFFYYQIFYFSNFSLFSILPHKILSCQVFDLFKKIIKNNTSSPRLNAFDIYIEYPSAMGEATKKSVAECHATYILYAR